MEHVVDHDVLIVGGGPIGLFLANLLGRQGCRVRLVEKGSRPPEESMAIGITPPSLEMLRQLGLDEVFVRRGVQVDLARVHEGYHTVGKLSFRALPHAYPFILSLPQATTIELLEDSLAKNRHVRFERRTRLLGFEQDEHRVTATLRQGSEAEEQVTASFLVGCDGHRSDVRTLSGIARCEEKDYRLSFMMADFADQTDLTDEAHLFFSRYGSVESFPLPGQQRRWILQTDRLIQPPDISLLIDAIKDRTGYDLSGADSFSSSAFSVRRFICESYHRNRVVLCGDAAHVMSPVGGQGMNTGFADAEFLADALLRGLRHGEEYPALFACYDRFRRIAFTAAANRAERGMWMGTRRGWMASVMRALFIRLLLSPLFARSLPGYFAMLSIPYHSLKTIDGGQH